MPKPQTDAEAALRAAITAAFAFGFNSGAPPQKQATVAFADVPTFDAAINALVSKKVVFRQKDLNILNVFKPASNDRL